MGILTQILGFLLSLAILVILHESGHFVLAKLFKTRVEKFYLFFNPWFSIFKFKKGQTEYGLGWLPLGGYVKISGMIDESLDKEQMKKPPQPWEFRSKPIWQRLFIMLGGVLVNFILALFIYAILLFTWGKVYLPAENVKYGVICDSLALEIGMKNGDKVLKVDTFKIKELRDIPFHILLDDAKSITVERNGEIIIIPIPEDFGKRMLENNVISLVTPIYPMVIDSLLPGKPAEKAGILKNDRIWAINEIETPSAYGFSKLIPTYKGKEIELLIERNKSRKKIKVKVNEEGIIGVFYKPFTDFLETKTIKYGFIESFPAGIALGVNRLKDYVRQFKIIFTKEGVKHLGGFGTIGSLFPKTWNWAQFWEMTAFLSLIFAFMNILPIPALDGGHVVFLLYEMVAGKKPGDKFLEYAQITGMMILFALLIYANGNDILKLFK